MANIFIGGAWPYANGSLHLGRLASLLPGDVLARYHRAKGDQVLYMSGSDCHGTPVAVQASQEGVSPEEITNRYHTEFTRCFLELGFTYDLYTRTDQPYHHAVVQELFLKLLHNGYLYKRTVTQTYCEKDHRFLPDRYVEGTCPVCGSRARGDQCDHCSTLLDPSQLTDRSCKLCGSTPTERPTEHYYLALSRFQEALESYTEQSKNWRENAVQLTKRYLGEGLQDRAATRDLSWGVDVPIEGFEGKKIYVWIEAVSGYLSASKQWAAKTGGSWEDFWKDSHAADGSASPIRAYYVHGKDNIPFHSLIWPALLLGAGESLHLPDRIVSSEYLTLEGRKFSTSRNWAVWLPDLLSRYQPDSIRYSLLAGGPEKRDADFSWRDFINSHNGELLGAFGNFVNRTLAFIMKSFGNQVPKGGSNPLWEEALAAQYAETGRLIEEARFKEALEGVFTLIRRANKFFDEEKPWQQIKHDRNACAQTLYTCVQIIANLSQLLQPFLPFSCEKIRTFLSIETTGWAPIDIPPERQLRPVSLLFERIDPERIQVEEQLLLKRAVEP